MRSSATGASSSRCRSDRDRGHGVLPDAARPDHRRGPGQVRIPLPGARGLGTAPASLRPSAGVEAGGGGPGRGVSAGAGAGCACALRRPAPPQADADLIVIAATGFFQTLLDLTIEEALVKYGFRFQERGDWGRLRRLFGRALELKLAGGVLAGVCLLALAPAAHALFGDGRLLKPMLI